MDYQIAWTGEAKENYREIAIYLLDSYSLQVADRFTDTVAAKIQLLENTPFIGRRLDGLPAVRKLPVAPFSVLYYTVVEEKVIILNILDSRRPVL